MMRIFYGALISIALAANASAQTSKSKNAPAQTGKSKIECAAPGMTTIAEIDYGTKLVRTWTIFDTSTNGPVTSSAKISRDKITWLVVKSVGSKSSRTTYTLDRKNRSLSVVNDNGRHLDTPCTAS